MPEKKVLLVEDSDTYAKLFSILLCCIEFPLSRVKTLAEAMDAIGQHCFDVVVLDLNLPDSAGLKTFTSLKKRFPNIPIVILSGQDDDALAIASVAQGAQDFVAKDKANADTLARSLRYAVERSERMLADQRNLFLERDLAFAREIQQHMLPSDAPAIDGFDIAGLCQPAVTCCGDFYDFISLPNGSWDFVMADVSSHGYAPALIMASVRRVLRTCATLQNIDACLTLANAAVTEDALDSHFVTMFLCRLEPERRMLTYTGAGHQSFLLKPDGTSVTLDCSGLPLGIDGDCEYGIVDTLSLQAGDIVLMMTDGVNEAMAPGDEPFGEQRAFASIQSHRELPAAEILEALLDEVQQFCHPESHHDDVSMVLIKAL